jgi:hypothetical protein
MSYFGGKSGAGVFQTLINLMPPHEVYIEPFLGGGAVMRLKRPAPLNIGVELAPGPIAAFVAAAAPPEKARGSKNGDERSPSAGDREGRRHASTLQAIPPGSAIAAVTARNGDYSGSTIATDDDAGSRALYGGGVLPLIPGPIAETSAEDRIAWTDDKGLHWQVRRGCGIEYLETLEYEGPGVLVYCDPPYLHSTRASSARYEHELTDLEHRRLLRVLRSLKCNVMISGYSSALYAKELKGWNATAFQAATRGAPAAEWVWYNFDKPTRLHDYRFLGDDFREREAIKRQQRRWIGKLKRMPRLQRLALLTVLQEIDG